MLIHSWFYIEISLLSMKLQEKTGTKLEREGLLEFTSRMAKFGPKVGSRRTTKIEKSGCPGQT